MELRVLRKLYFVQPVLHFRQPVVLWGRYMTILRLTGLGLIIIFLCSCSALKLERGTVGDFSTSSWALSYMAGAQMNTDRRPVLRLADGVSVSGFSGCNTYISDVSITKKTVVFGNISGTRKACPKAVMRFEGAYLEALQKTTAWKIERNSLRLYNGAGETLLRFRRMGAPSPQNI